MGGGRGNLKWEESGHFSPAFFCEGLYRDREIKGRAGGGGG